MRTSRCTSWVSKTQRNQRPSCQHSMDHGESKGVPKKQSTSASWVMLKPLCDHNKLWKILRDGDTRPPYLSPEKSVCKSRSRHGKTDWFQIEKGVCQGCTMLAYLFNLYAQYIMRNARLDQAQTGIKIAGRNINNLRYADDNTLMAESKEPKTFLMKVKEESEKAGLKLNTQKTKIIASSPITS